MRLKQLLVRGNISYDEYIMDLDRFSGLLEPDGWNNIVREDVPIILPFDFPSFTPEVVTSTTLWTEESIPSEDTPPDKLTLLHHEAFEAYITSHLLQTSDHRMAYARMFTLGCDF